jgi:hypothetical protein
MADAQGRAFTIDPQADGLLYTEDTLSTEIADWDVRKDGPDVLWFHNFDSPAEVDAFRWTGGGNGGVGNDPLDNTAVAGSCTWVADGFAGGGCVQLLHPTGNDNNHSSWWRPFSPLVGSVNASGSLGNGRPDDDPGAGIIAPRQWNPDLSSNMTSQWAGGYYAKAEMQTLFDPPDGGGNYDGEEYYFQYRHKTDPRRWLTNAFPGGKRLYFTRTDQSNTSQEYNVYGGQEQAGWTPGEPDYFGMYRSGGTADVSWDGATGGSGNAAVNLPIHGNQPDVPAPNCSIDDDPSIGSINNCWQYDDQWTTFLIHIAPGTSVVDADQGSTGPTDTLMRVWVARYGETSYTKIWDQADAYMPQFSHAGHNAVLLSIYMNNIQFNQPFWFRNTQLILSRSFIPCPQVYS